MKKKFGSSPELLDRELERRPKHEFKRMHTTRRLSANRAKQEVYEDFEALTTVLKSFKEDGDDTATVLEQQIGNIKFLGAVYLLHEVLPVLSQISKVSRKGRFHLAVKIAPAVEYTF